MKRLVPLAGAVLLLLPGCDKLKETAGKVGSELKQSAGKAGAESEPSADAGLPDSRVQQVTTANFESFTNQLGKVVIVDFYADWCGPCKQLAPVLARISSTPNTNVVVGKVNVDEAKDLAMSHGVRSIPDVRIYHNGRMVDRFEGAIGEGELREKLRPYLSVQATAPVTAATSSGPTDIRVISGEGFESFKATPDKLVIVDFYADWCGPCKRLSPILDRVAGEFGGAVTVGKINVDQARAAAASAGVQGIPDVRFYRNGVEVDRFVGLIPEAEIRRKIKQSVPQVTAQAPVATPAAPAATTPAGAQPAVAPISKMPKDWLPPGIQKR